MGKGCPFTHSKDDRLKPNHPALPCYTEEAKPGGCERLSCTFKHKNPAQPKENQVVATEARVAEAMMAVTEKLEGVVGRMHDVRVGLHCPHANMSPASQASQQSLGPDEVG